MLCVLCCGGGRGSQGSSGERSEWSIVLMPQPFCLSFSSMVSVLGTGMCVSALKHRAAPRKGGCAAIAANYTIIPPDGPSPSASPALLWVES